MRVVHTEASLLNAIAVTKSEAHAAFNNDGIHGEIPGAAAAHRIQVLADNYGNVIHLGERDCSMRTAKVVEEAPAPASPKSSVSAWARAWSVPAKPWAIATPALSSSCTGRRVLLHRDEHSHQVEHR
jgi:acetyl/propionyl-CoA carboxylase alpha subunit